MILQPAAIALLSGSLIIGLLTAYAAYNGLKIIRGWDLRSGSEAQLDLEKKTYLVSTLMACAFGFLILSFFLFIYAAEDLHRLFVGAMCAAGTLNANAYGYPALLLKIINCLLAGLWLIFNHADNRACDYPLIKKKYALLLLISPLVIGEAALQAAYFLNLRAHVITSCCGSLFSAGAQGVASQLAALPVEPMMTVFFGTMAAAVLLGTHYYRKGAGTSGALFSLCAILALPVAAAALISFLSCYLYELPTHHCPFCILQKEYHYAGYLIYATALGGTVAGAGVGLLMPFRSVPSLQPVIPGLQKRLCATGVVLYLILTVFALYRIIFTDFVLAGY